LTNQRGLSKYTLCIHFKNLNLNRSKLSGQVRPSRRCPRVIPVHFFLFFCENDQFKRVLAIRDRISIKNHEIFFKDKIFKKGEVHFPHALEGGSSFIEEQV